MVSEDVPAGFRPASVGGPFGKEVGPFFVNDREDDFRVGLRIEARHINPNGWVHGGVFMTLADHAASLAVFHSLAEKTPFATVSLNCDFLTQAVRGVLVAEKLDELLTSRSSG